MRFRTVYEKTIHHNNPNSQNNYLGSLSELSKRMVNAASHCPFRAQLSQSHTITENISSKNLNEASPRKVMVKKDE